MEAKSAPRLTFSLRCPFRNAGDVIYLNQVSGADDREWQFRVSTRHFALPFWCVDQHVGSFLQVTYDSQGDHFSMDNTDIRYANKTKLGGKELVYGLDLNNNPTLDDLWNQYAGVGLPVGRE